VYRLGLYIPEKETAEKWGMGSSTAKMCKNSKIVRENATCYR
jgi:hypothetical protein